MYYATLRNSLHSTFALLFVLAERMIYSHLFRDRGKKNFEVGEVVTIAGGTVAVKTKCLLLERE